MSTIKANTYLDASGGNTATINGITPVLSSQAQAEAGTDNTTQMTPLRTEQHTVANDIGWGQTWQNLAGSRTAGTTYQNTTGKPIFWYVYTGASSQIPQASVDGTTWVDVGNGQTGNISSFTFSVIPNNYYYRVNNAGGITRWAELR